MPPGAPLKPFRNTDVATLAQVGAAAEQVLDVCVKGNGRPQNAGWMSVGGADELVLYVCVLVFGRPQYAGCMSGGGWEEAIGVFVWETGSLMDMVIR